MVLSPLLIVYMLDVLSLSLSPSIHCLLLDRFFLSRFNHISLSFLSHLVLLRAFYAGQFAVKLVRDDKVKVSRVLFVRDALDRAFNLLAFPCCQDIIQVEHGLLPVGRGNFRA